MRILKQEQFLPITLEEAWDFFSNPVNLNEITPDYMTFEITSKLPAKMYAGMMITYRIKPLLNIPINWCTEITHVDNGNYFIDEQRKGPYRIWHHEHHFKSVKGGVCMTDLLYYDIGKSIFGWIAGKLFVHKKVKDIFEYRRKKLEVIFSTTTQNKQAQTTT